jgi:uncharacterized iron-regulated protein
MKSNKFAPAAMVVVLAACASNPQPGTTTAADTVYHAGNYRVFNGAGERASLDQISAAIANAQVLFVGETHDDPTGHMLELELLERAAALKPQRPLALSLEFFERDAQPLLDDYLAGRVSDSAFIAGSHPWPRYRTDYRPLIEFAKAHHIPVIAANAPRRFVTLVARNGRAALDTLDEHSRALIAPLPYAKASPAYRDKWIATMSEVMEQEGKKCGVPVANAAAPPGSHGNMGNQLDSQVLWDATMANSISRYLEQHPTALVLHMVGDFHVERGTGIPEQLQSYRPGTRTLTVTLRPQDKIDAFEPAPRGQWSEFVIQTDKARTIEALECLRPSH